MKFDMIPLTMVVNPPSGRPYEGEETGPEETTPVVINLGQVRSFYPRKYGRAGTRIELIGGSAVVVTDEFAAVAATVAGKGGA